MFIKETKTKNKKTGAVYTKHVLVESIWIDGTSRQRTIMQLGHLELPRSEWRRLAHALECQINGQLSVLELQDKKIEDLALSLYSNYTFTARLREQQEIPENNQRQFVSVDLNNVRTGFSRSLGPELACEKAWDLLGFDHILNSEGFSEKDRALAKALIFGKLISPGSERHMYEWFKKISSLNEFGGYDISKAGKDAFYEIGDKLFEHKSVLEDALYHREQKIFPRNGVTIFLYDLTNTYMEGACLSNPLAAFGHCKSKRFDQRIVTLSLVVTGDGLPVYSHIYAGNQSEPETMEDMIVRIERTTASGQLPLVKPTIVMDRGIATKENLTYLNANGYPYIVIERGDGRKGYEEEFLQNREEFTLIKDGEKSAYGDENKVYIKKMEAMTGEKVCKVLCVSEGKARKEQAIDKKKESRMMEKIEHLNRSIVKGTVVKPMAKLTKLRNILKPNMRVAQQYLVKADFKEGTDVIQRFRLEKKAEEVPMLYGCYVIESTHVELTGSEIWRLYMTLTMVENAFRCMKSELGMRPVYHQIAERTQAHLFLTVLSYHMLITIEKLLRQKDDHRTWETIRDVLSTHMRNTVMLNGKNGDIYHIRVSGTPEDVHQQIYDELGIRDRLTPLQTTIKKDSG